VDILASFFGNFSRFVDILDLECRVLYFSIMYKTRLDIEIKIEGEKTVRLLSPGIVRAR